MDIPKFASYEELVPFLCGLHLQPLSHADHGKRGFAAFFSYLNKTIYITTDLSGTYSGQVMVRDMDAYCYYASTYEELTEVFRKMDLVKNN